MKACNSFEPAANYLGRNLQSGVKGATINAIASSAPELITTLIFLFWYKDSAGLSAGVATTAGSAVFNAMVIPAMCIFAVVLWVKNAKFEVSKWVVFRDGIFLLSAEIILINMLGTGALTVDHAAVLLSVYALYMAALYAQTMLDGGTTTPAEEYEDALEYNGSTRIEYMCSLEFAHALLHGAEFTVIKAWAVLVASVALMSLGCWMLADSVVEVAAYFGMNTFFAAVVLAAAATSVPDTIISMRDAKNGNYNDAVSNAVGSNIFDICVCLGLPLALWTNLHGPLVIGNAAGVSELRIVLLVLTALVVVTLLLPIRLGIGVASVFLSGYIFYAAYAWCSGLGMPWAHQLSTFIQAVL